MNHVPDTFNDLWTEAKDVNLSEVRTGGSRFKILRRRRLQTIRGKVKDPQKSEVPSNHTVFVLKRVI